MRTKNLDDVLTMYTPDAVFTDPEGHTFQSTEALRALYEQVFATYDADLDLTRVSLKVKGDGVSAGSTAVESDDYHENLRTRKTDLLAEHCGNVLSTWIKQDDDRWIMSRQAWTEKACPAAPVH
jgi:ketosteroid isomerase-like protein